MRLKLFKKTYVTPSSNMLGRKNEVIILTARYFISHDCYQEGGRKDMFWKEGEESGWKGSRDGKPWGGIEIGSGVWGRVLYMPALRGHAQELAGFSSGSQLRIHGARGISIVQGGGGELKPLGECRNR